MPAKEVGRSIYPVLLDREYLTVCLNIWIHAGAARRVCSARSVHFVPKLPRSQTIANCSKNSAKPGLQPRPVAIYLEKKKQVSSNFKGTVRKYQNWPEQTVSPSSDSNVIVNAETFQGLYVFQVLCFKQIVSPLFYLLLLTRRYVELHNSQLLMIEKRWTMGRTEPN